MKYTNYILPALSAAMILTSCEEQAWEWSKPANEGNVTLAEIPLAVKEVIANYDDIKTYSEQYTPNMKVGIGFGADLYVAGGTYQDLVNANFQMATPGNAMKHDAIVTNAGALNFATVDTMLAVMNANNIQLYGHNFIWHTQQRSAYLKSLIAPTMVIETDSDIKSVLSGDDSDFEGGTTGSWGAWGNSSTKDAANPGKDSEYCMHLTNPTDANNWSAQCAYTFSEPLDPNTEYTIRFWAKSTSGAGALQFQYQNSETYGSQGGYNTFNITTDWTQYEFSFTPEPEDANRILLNFGAVAAEYWIDNIEFGTKVEDPMESVLGGDDFDFEGGTKGSWGSWGNSSSSEAAAPGYNDSEYCLHLNNPTDADNWSAQCAYTFSTPLDNTKKYILQFYAKCSSASGALQFQYQNSETYGSQGGYNTFNIGTEWALYEFEFTPSPEDANRIIFNFGAVAADYYIDNIKFGPAKDQSSEVKAAYKIVRKANKYKGIHKSRTYFVSKTAEEKRAAMLGAMESWIKGVSEHLTEKGVTPYGYDVVNEAIADGTNLPRGLNNIFGGTTKDDDGNVIYDSTPTETEDGGLTLNWADGHWYWGYYIGDDYAAQAFKMARKYLPNTKLFINDYNLETSPAKRAAFIEFAKDIDAKAGEIVVDGLGTQCHLTLDVSADESFDAQIEAFMEQVDASLTDLAATGKLVRITELDISLGTATPSTNQLQAQFEAYRRVFESYKRIVPEAQQSGITIWTLSDNADEHKYWLPDESPNLWDSNYLRKWAYKGVCDGIAGEDIGLKFTGEDYKTYYNKNNTANF
ncbi:MAG: endo-1,4-beta-xylanase [Bacteroidaceae bacterium]|nr:endo-1,4-beta-xylanase [Bacteroidaceae bacterium]